MPTPPDNLAALREHDGLPPRNRRRPVRRKLDIGRTVEYPAPLVLAEAYLLPHLRQCADVFSSGAALLARPIGSHLPPTAITVSGFAVEARDLLAELPDRPDAGRHYNDLRVLAQHGEPSHVLEYLHSAIAAARRLAPTWKPPRHERGPALTPQQAKAASRRRLRDAEEATARWWLSAENLIDIDDERPAPGEYISAVDLYARASEAIAELISWKQDPTLDWDEVVADGYPPEPRLPGPRTFYAVADQIIGQRRFVRGIRTYAIPDQVKENTLDIDRIRDETIVLDHATETMRRYTQALAALQDQRDGRLAVDWDAEAALLFADEAAR